MERHSRYKLGCLTFLVFLWIQEAWGIAYVEPPKPPFPFEVEALRSSASLGDVSSQLELARWYEYGYGVEQDSRAAAKWYLKAAVGGNIEARHEVVILYELGEGLPRSHANALMWYRKAKDSGDLQSRDAAYKIAGNYQKRNEPRRAAEWLLICARAANSWCRHEVARAYREGLSGFPKSYSQAMTWFLRTVDVPAAERDFLTPCAEYEIGQMYALGEGTERNYHKAMQWYVMGTHDLQQRNCLGAPELAIANLHAEGLGVEQNYGVAGVWYRKAAERGITEAMLALADLSATGRGFPQSDRRALEWYEKAAMPETPWLTSAPQRQLACQRLFALLERGKDLPRDDHEAFEWYRSNADRGDVFARRGLALSYQFGYRVTADGSTARLIAIFLKRSGAVPEDDALYELVHLSSGGVARWMEPTLLKMGQPGQFLSAVDDLVADLTLHQVAISD